ncbi:MAG: PilZ domain-containing protein [Candidatus Omnitrophica bacterium]|nr:PilZ domain-containing protein [Candidatus Omnitrophota bacterium]
MIKNKIIKKLKSYIYFWKLWNRRRYPRFAPVRSVDCSCIYNAGGGRVRAPIGVVNISQGGLLTVTSEKKIFPGTKVEIRFHLPNRNNEDSINAEIVRTYRMHGQSWYYSGVKFENPEDDNIRLLLDYVLLKV